MSRSLGEFAEKAHPDQHIAIAFDADINITLLYVGVDGDVELELEGSPGTSKVYPSVTAGTWISMPIKQIKSAGTGSSTATDFVGHR